MPLIKSKSQKAFSHNVKAEMDAGKHQDQALAIAYSVKRKAPKKKMADGGILDTVVKSFTEDPYDNTTPHPDAKKRQLDPEKTKQFVKGFNGDEYAEGGVVKSKMQFKKGPRFVESPIIKAKLRDQEDHLIESMPPASPKEQPPKKYDEVDAKKKGPDVPALHMKMMAEGGKINKAVSMKKAEEDMVEHPAGLEEDNDQMRPKGFMDDQDPAMYAEGGDIHREMDMQPEPEEEEEHHDSVAAAIMAKRRKMAEGGEIKSHDSIYADDSDQADLSRNADEDANEEDQLSFNALRKENYSESEGLDQLDQPMDSNEHGDEIESDKHDMISKIRSKMKSRKQF